MATAITVYVYMYMHVHVCACPDLQVSVILLVFPSSKAGEQPQAFACLSHMSST